MTTVTVWFELDLQTGEDMVREDELTANFEKYRDDLVKLDSLDGALVITAASEPKLEVLDEVPSAVQRLCFEAVTAVLGGHRDSYLYRYMTSSAHVVVIPVADQVRLVGDYIPSFNAAASDLLPALYGCGTRFIAFLERLGATTDALVAHLKQFADDARVSLHQR